MSHNKSKSHRNIFRVDTNNTHGWQVRYVVDKNHYSKLFSDKKYGGRDNALIEAKKYRDDLKILVKEKREKLDLRPRKFIYSDFATNNKSGIIGINRTSTKERSGNYSHHWQTALIDAEGKLINRSRAIKKWGEKGALLEIIKIRMDGLQEIIDNIDNTEAIERINEMLEYYETLSTYLKHVKPNEEDLLFKVLSQDIPDKTERVDLINNRIGQFTFRRQVLEFWNGKCCITKSSSLLVASHIKPWRVSSASERIDPINGLAFSPDYDKAFDHGLISFKNDGNIIISKNFKNDAELLNIKSNVKIEGLTPRHNYYLKYHRENIFSE